jgi:nucleoside 2-deoxyribosyltransferase
MEKLKVYLASRWEDRDEIITYRDFLEKNAHIKSTARWLTPTHPRLRNKVAKDTKTGAIVQLRDYDDILEADAVIVFSPLKAHGNGTGGRHVECGIAIGTNKPIFVVGVRENVFHCNKLVTNVTTVKRLVPHLNKLAKLKSKISDYTSDMTYDGYDHGIPPRNNNVEVFNRYSKLSPRK